MIRRPQLYFSFLYVFHPYNAAISKLFVNFIRKRMARFHFWSMEATPNKSDFTNRFDDRDFVIAVYTCFIHKCDRFEFISDFLSLNQSENSFPVDGSLEQRHH
jgi:hypothetical protein